MFADITSANIVGYQGLKTNSQLSPSIGWTFLPMNLENGYVLLKDVVAKDMDPDIDCLQVLDPSSTLATGMYSYFSQELADEMSIGDYGVPGMYDELVGWWDAGMAGEPDNYRGERIVKAGEAFLGLFGSYGNVTFNLPDPTNLID